MAEPDERWKAQLKARIDENLQNLLKDAKATYEQKVAQTDDYMTSRRLYMDYLLNTDNLKKFAKDEFTYALERERKELEWIFSAEAPIEDPELEALKTEQFALLHAMQMGGDAQPSAQGNPYAHPHRHAHTSEPLTHASHTSAAEANHDPFGFPEFAASRLSPLFAPTPLGPVSESEEGSESGEYDSETDSRTPSPSPPSTPGSYFRENPEEEAARIRAERNAKQQEEFHRRAEEIRRRNQEKQQQKQKQVQWVDPTDTPFYDSETPSRSSASNSTTTSTTSSSCNSPQISTTSTLEVPFVIAPKTKEDLGRLLIFHEQQWQRIGTFNSLQWSDFPWPVLNFIGPRSDRELTLKDVTEYVLAAFDWQTDEVRSKERLRQHIQRWHPDRFDRQYLSKVPQMKGERERVRAGAALVARHLTEVLGRFDNLGGGNVRAHAKSAMKTR